MLVPSISTSHCALCPYPFFENTSIPYYLPYSHPNHSAGILHVSFPFSLSLSCFTAHCIQPINSIPDPQSTIPPDCLLYSQPAPLAIISRGIAAGPPSHLSAAGQHSTRTVIYFLPNTTSSCKTQPMPWVPRSFLIPLCLTSMRERLALMRGVLRTGDSCTRHSGNARPSSTLGLRRERRGARPNERCGDWGLRHSTGMGWGP